MYIQEDLYMDIQEDLYMDIQEVIGGYTGGYLDWIIWRIYRRISGLDYLDYILNWIKQLDYILSRLWEYNSIN